MPEHYLRNEPFHQRLAVLGRFVTAGNQGRALQAKLKVHADGRFEYQQSGLSTWWSRGTEDSLTQPRVYGAVDALFKECRDRLGTEKSESVRQTLYWDMLYGLRGYHTLVKEGYRPLRSRVEKIAEETKIFIQKKTTLKESVSLGGFNQSWFDVGQGCCAGFTMDWLRRCFHGRYAYNQKKRVTVNVNNAAMKPSVGRKMEQIRVIQHGDRVLRTYVAGGQLGYGVVNMQVIGEAQHVGEGKFLHMEMHPPLYLNIDRGQQRFYGNMNAIRTQPNPFDLLVSQMTNHALARDGIGWRIGLTYYDFWGSSPSGGHAVGAFFTPAGHAKFFDPNFGYADMSDYSKIQQPVAAKERTADWLRQVVTYYSFTQAVTTVQVYPVTMPARQRQ